MSRSETQGIRLCILPKENLEEGAVAAGIKGVGVRSINELLMYMETASGCYRKAGRD